MDAITVFLICFLVTVVFIIYVCVRIGRGITNMCSSHTEEMDMTDNQVLAERITQLEEQIKEKEEKRVLLARIKELEEQL